MPPPRFFTCYLCSQQYAKHSLPIHQKTCYDKALTEWNKKPANARGPPPTHPADAPPPDQAGTAGAAPVVGRLQPCKHCGRTFQPDRIEKHEGACGGLKNRATYSSRAKRMAAMGLDPDAPVDAYESPKKNKSSWKKDRAMLKAAMNRKAASGEGKWDMEVHAKSPERPAVQNSPPSNKPTTPPRKALPRAVPPPAADSPDRPGYRTRSPPVDNRRRTRGDDSDEEYVPRARRPTRDSCEYDASAGRAVDTEDNRRPAPRKRLQIAEWDRNDMAELSLDDHFVIDLYEAYRQSSFYAPPRRDSREPRGGYDRLRDEPRPRPRASASAREEPRRRREREYDDEYEYSRPRGRGDDWYDEDEYGPPRRRRKDPPSPRSPPDANIRAAEYQLRLEYELWAEKGRRRDHRGGYGR
eukprot:NODE_448_length_1493_cov_40.515373_g416_i0.p1 GENE.NODE_448_length_1493_cov_40.515373_g416_i0~~NODE_448_length_1493_cov_40.515373_g416_i0.p1  ORF type:complete len:411 (+),score=55.62 NODE_448_length_1493_cov_40.515373_g416_i0:121-1353(+)